MRAAMRVAAVCGLLVMGSLVLIAPKASADWCSSSMMSYTPTSGAPGAQVTFTFTFENMISTTIQISDFSVSFSWGGYDDFGVFVAGPYDSITQTSVQTLPTTAGPESITAYVAGQANTDPYPIACYYGPMLFTVTSAPPLSVSVQANATETDVGLPVSFTCVTSGGTPPYNYSWAMGDGIGAWTKDVIHTYAISGSMDVGCEVRDNTGSLATGTYTLVVHPAPKITLSTTHLAAAPGTLLPFDAVVSGGSGSFTYAWSFGDGVSGSTANVTHAYAASGNFTASVTATDACGGMASASLPVTITRLVATASASTSSAGTGDTITFTATATGGAGGPYLYRWDFGDGSTGEGQTMTHVYRDPGTYTPKLTVTDALNASTTTTLPNVSIQGLPAILSGAGLPFLVIGIAAAIAAVSTGILLLRRRRKVSTPPSEAPTPPTGPPSRPP